MATAFVWIRASSSHPVAGGNYINKILRLNPHTKIKIGLTKLMAYLIISASLVFNKSANAGKMSWWASTLAKPRCCVRVYETSETSLTA